MTILYRQDFGRRIHSGGKRSGSGPSGSDLCYSRGGFCVTWCITSRTLQKPTPRTHRGGTGTSIYRRLCGFCAKKNNSWKQKILDISTRHFKLLSQFDIQTSTVLVQRKLEHKKINSFQLLRR